MHQSLGGWGLEWPFDDMHQIGSKHGRGGVQKYYHTTINTTCEGPNLSRECMSQGADANWRRKGSACIATGGTMAWILLEIEARKTFFDGQHQLHSKQ